MKKLFVVALIVMVLCMTKENSSSLVIIPNDAIRLRVIASSNKVKDQQIKYKVANDLKQDLSKLLQSSNSINETRKILKTNMDFFADTINKTVNNDDYDINYGINHFPKKVYKGVIYPEGDYESLVVTLGNGLGKNFWYVLFPPLCLLEGEENNQKDVEYKFFVKELINKYF